MPRKCEEEVGGEPNAYTDGSMLKPKGNRWAIGGVGIWWPWRKAELTEDEKQWAQSEEKAEGKMLWNVFNQLKNSSTRCEIAATMIAMLASIATYMGIDNQATVGTGTQTIDHQRKKKGAKLRNEDGGMILGGSTSI